MAVLLPLSLIDCVIIFGPTIFTIIVFTAIYAISKQQLKRDAGNIKQAAYSEAKQARAAVMFEAEKMKKAAEKERQRSIAKGAKTKAATMPGDKVPLQLVFPKPPCADQTLQNNASDALVKGNNANIPDSASICSSLTTGEDGTITPDDIASNTDSSSEHGDHNVCRGDAGASRDMDANAPLGRLRVLCPKGPFNEMSVEDAVAAARARGSSTVARHWWPRRKGRRRGPASKSSSSSTTAFSNTLYSGIDPLAARWMYNAALSPLCRLPDDVLVRIMSFLDEDKSEGWLDIMCLRQTSRLFLRLFSRSEFQHLHDTAGFFTTSSYYTDTSEAASTRAPAFLPWKAQAHVSTGDAEERQKNINWFKMNSRLQCEAFQGNCHDAHSKGDDAYRHCYACKADHPARFFSHTKTGKSGRLCIAYEGHVRLCSHKTVKLDDVLESSLAAGSRLADGLFFHYKPFQEIESDLHFTPPMESGVGPSTATGLPRPRPHLHIVCDHPSHTPDHHLSLEPPPPGTSTQATTGASDSPFPSFVVHDRVIRGVWYKVATWSYTAHVDLSELGGTDPANRNGPLTAEEFRSCIKKLRSGHSPARYIAPEDHPGILQELRCVDPNRCGCLRYPGLLRPQPLTETGGRGLGRRKGFRCQTHAVSRTLYTRSSDIDQIHVRLASCEEDATDYEEDGCASTTHHPRCLKIHYTRTIRLRGCYLDHAPMWGPALYHHRRYIPIHVVRRMLDELSENYVPYGWIQALDVGHLEENGNWPGCQHRRCKMNRKYIRPHAGLLQELNVVCIDGCQWIAKGMHMHWERTESFSFPEREQWGQREMLCRQSNEARDKENAKELQASGKVTVALGGRKVQTVFVKKTKDAHTLDQGR